MKKKISTDKAPAAIGPYSQGIETENLIFLSGQIPLDPETMKPSNFFTPGMGVPIAILTDRAYLVTFEKHFINNQLKLSLTSMIDASKRFDIEGLLKEC